MSLTEKIDQIDRSLRPVRNFLLIFLVVRLTDLFILFVTQLDIFVILLTLVMVITGIVMFLMALSRGQFTASGILLVLVVGAFLVGPLVEAREALIAYYWLRTQLFGNKITCTPAAGSPIPGGLLRVCAEWDWGITVINVMIVKIDGDPSALTSYDLNRPSEEVPSVVPAPFGIVTYNYTHIADGYYLVWFGDEIHSFN